MYYISQQRAYYPVLLDRHYKYIPALIPSILESPFERLLSAMNNHFSHYSFNAALVDKIRAAFFAKRRECGTVPVRIHHVSRQVIVVSDGGNSLL